MIVPQKMRAQFSDKEEFNEHFCLYRFEMIAPQRSLNEAGQYVIIEVGEGQNRAYSMCDRPDIDTSFEILVDHRPNGIGTNFLRNLKFGQVINFVGPLGQFYINPETDAQAIVLVATGSGVSPFKSMITDQLQLKNSSRPLTLIWGMRHDEDFFWLEDFYDIARSYSQFNFIPTVTQPSDIWDKNVGRVTDLIKDTQFTPQTDFYLCGRGEMIDEVANILAQKQIPSTRIFSEKFNQVSAPTS
jgi:CDP-4-dehydro-6-deoxyglucose reductase